MRAIISKIIISLLVLGFLSVSGIARHQQRRQRTRAAVNKHEEKYPVTVDKRGAEEKVRAAEEDCATSDEKPKPEVRFKASMLCGKALSLPKPAYPEDAKAAKVSGAVAVNVVTDEKGRVIWAKAISGHSLLQAASVKAACRARYSPTLLSGSPVKMETVITYNFVAQ